jgi:excisionase family DNA binding protein
MNYEVGTTKMLTLRETAELLGVHPNTVREWSNRGSLPFYSFSTRGDRRFSLGDLEAFIARHRRGESAGSVESPLAVAQATA